MKFKDAVQVVQAHRNELRTERRRLHRYHDWYVAETNRRHPRYMDPDVEFSLEDELTLETNHPYAYIDTMRASICPTNPQISITTLNPEYETAGRLRERLANAAMKRNRLYRNGRRVAGHAAWSGFGATKTYWNFNKNCPETRNVNPLAFFWDRGVQFFEDSSYICEATPIRRDLFDQRRHRRILPDGDDRPALYDSRAADRATFGNYPGWLRKEDVFAGDRHKSPGDDVFDFVTVWEFYDFSSDTYWHILDDVGYPLLERELPYKYARNPYDLITFNDNLLDSSGISDIQLIANAQARLNEIDTIELMHAHSTFPWTAMNEQAFDKPGGFLDAVQKISGPAAVVKANIKNGYSFDQALRNMPAATISPSFHNMRSRSEHIISYILGLPAWQRGGTSDSEHATEVALQDSGYRTRIDLRAKDMAEWVSSVAKKYIGLYADKWDAFDPIPIVEPGQKRATLVNYEDLAFHDPETFERDYYFHFEAVPFSPTEEHNILKLQKLQQYLPVLFNNPDVDQRRLTSAIVTLLREPQLLTEEAAVRQAPQVIPGQPGQPGAAGQPGTANLPPEMQEAFGLIQNSRGPSPGVSEAPGRRQL